jgi:signal transduction histidine kinase
MPLFIYDVYQYYSRHKILLNLMNRITVNMAKLPKASDLVEQDYQTLLTLLFEDKAKITSKADVSQTEMIDYYTLWVHQIKTPISAMRLLTQTEESMQNSELSTELFKIERYVEMVLGYLRIESISSDLVLSQYYLSNVVKQAIRKYATIFIGKKITLDFKEMDCLVLTDEKWLVFVIEQILSNALKYTKSGTISIYMEAEKTLVIKDSGIGIASEDLPRVFEKGFTGFNGRMDKKSTGIGLYLCKKILNKLSHKVTITSQIGLGTMVKIDLSSVKILIE